MNLRGLLLETGRALMDFLYPPSCLLCGFAHPGECPVCPDCFAAVTDAALRYEPPRRSLDGVSILSVLLPYDHSCRTLVHAFKYHNLPSVANMTGNLLARKSLPLLGSFSGASLVPVPLHPDKLRSRGYNQCRRLADGFSEYSGHPIREDLLTRTVFTGTQTALGAGERRENVRGAFRYTGATSLRGEPVILLDDVMTTGSTLSECVRTLRDGGAGEIAVCVVASPDVGDDG